MDKGYVEISRSFSFKLNLGNYENVDFFCAEKAEVPGKDADAMSEKLYAFCKAQVERDVALYKRERDALKNGSARKFERRGVSRDNAEHDMGAGVNDFGGK